MSLILIKPPTPVDELGMRAEGMDATRVDVTPGRPPPWLIPHCHQCGVMVERFTVDWIASPFYVPIQFQCHGKTGGTKVSYQDVMRINTNPTELLWVFTETNGNHRAKP